MDDISYGNSNFYNGENGKNYFKWQNSIASQMGKINARKFSSYIGENDTVLDFGCGGGHTLATINCKHKIGIDINPNAIDEAKKYRDIEITNDISNIKDNSIDIIISNHCLEHIPYPIMALKQMKNKLKKNGKLILCLPIDDWRAQKKYDFKNINHHLYTWTPQLLGNCLSEVGFDIKDIKIYTHAWPPNYVRLSKLPQWAFDSICFLTSIIYKRRQLICVAVRRN